MPARLDGAAVAIEGVLAYEPQEEGPPLLAVVLAVAAALVLGVGLIEGRRRFGRGRESSRPPGIAA